MKNTTKILGLLLFVAIIGFSFSACEDNSPKDVLDGTTWKTSFYENNAYVTVVLTFKSPNFTMNGTQNGVTQPKISGTYSVSGDKVTFITNDGSRTETISGNKLSFDGATFIKQ